MHDNPANIKTHQAKLLMNDAEVERFDAARQSLGDLQKATAARELALLGVELVELYRTRASSPKAILHALQSELMELDILRMEHHSANSAKANRA